MLLTSLSFQRDADFDIIIADQSEDERIFYDTSLRTIIRLLKIKNHEIRMLRNMPVLGMAQQRQFLLEQSQTRYSLFIDDDLILEPYVIRNLCRTIENEQCGFVGNAVIGLSYLADIRPHQQHIEFWETEIKPEIINPGQDKWERHKLHNAANVYHVQQQRKVSTDSPIKYKVAWVGGCVLYDTEKLKDTGGFLFWKDLPKNHCGEDVLAQLRVMKKYGGCGILPSGVYHQELPTSVPDRRINAPEYLPI